MIAFEVEMCGLYHPWWYNRRIHLWLGLNSFRRGLHPRLCILRPFRATGSVGYTHGYWYCALSGLLVPWATPTVVYIAPFQGFIEALGIRFMGFGRNRQSEIRNRQSEIRNPQSAIKNPTSDTWHPTSHILHPASLTSHPQNKSPFYVIFLLRSGRQVQV